METLVAVAHHKNQDCYGSRVKPNRPARFGGCSSHFAHFRDINCRSFQYGAGLLPTPFASCITPVTKTTPSSSSSSFAPSSSSTQKTPSPATKGHIHCKNASINAPIPINLPKKVAPFDYELSDNVPFSELWAGPTYSNSPPPSSLPIPKFSMRPPSSLPIPKFSMRPKRTVSLELPVSDSGIKVHPIAKSAPPSPTREHNQPPKDLFFSVDSATKTLRRILNLDVADE